VVTLLKALAEIAVLALLVYLIAKLIMWV